MRYEAYILKKNPREDSAIHRDLNRVGTYITGNVGVDLTLDDFIKSFSEYDYIVKYDPDVIVYATNYVKLNLDNNVDDKKITVEYRHPVYIGTVSKYKLINNLLDEIYSLSIVC